MTLTANNNIKAIAYTAQPKIDNTLSDPNAFERNSIIGQPQSSSAQSLPDKTLIAFSPSLKSPPKSVAPKPIILHTHTSAEKNGDRFTYVPGKPNAKGMVIWTRTIVTKSGKKTTSQFEAPKNWQAGSGKTLYIYKSSVKTVPNEKPTLWQMGAAVAEMRNNVGGLFSPIYTNDTNRLKREGYNPNGTAAQLTGGGINAALIWGGGWVAGGVMKGIAVLPKVAGAIETAGQFASKLPHAAKVVSVATHPVTHKTFIVGGAAADAGFTYHAASTGDFKSATTSLILGGAGSVLAGRMMNTPRNLDRGRVIPTGGLKLADVLKAPQKLPIPWPNESFNDPINAIIAFDKSLTHIKAIEISHLRFATRCGIKTPKGLIAVHKHIIEAIKETNITVKDVGNMLPFSVENGFLNLNMAVIRAKSLKIAIQKSSMPQRIIFDMCRNYLNPNQNVFMKGASSAQIVRRIEQELVALDKFYPHGNLSVLQNEVHFLRITPEQAAKNMAATEAEAIKRGMFNKDEIALTNVRRVKGNLSPQQAVEQTAQLGIKANLDLLAENLGLNRHDREILLNAGRNESNDTRVRLANFAKYIHAHVGMPNVPTMHVLKPIFWTIENDTHVDLLVLNAILDKYKF
jgi:hypothetical protein